MSVAADAELLNFVLGCAEATAGQRRPPDFVYCTMYELLAVHGRAWSIAADQTVRRSFRCRPGCCFDNAYRLARASRGLRYVEGVAMSVIPMHHAWVVNAADEVVDPTWADHTDIGSAYFGVVIDLDTMRAVRSKDNTSALDNWQRGHPLLRAEWRPT